ncbi:hypothetical protein [Mesorhizobium sp.]|uniref:hypothetical protein n=1 Tax=Mesorhizobium sp. TaxID=1871066 RepID=UPI00121ECEE0|nr:hypothetical protein [Mesorhizobium sp.]TIS45793.1 MAG: hypothetical protein E5W96_29335 [Mesorhizobium sp.]
MAQKMIDRFAVRIGDEHHLRHLRGDGHDFLWLEKRLQQGQHALVGQETLSLVGIHPDNSGSLAKRNALTLTASNDNYLYLHAEIGVAFAFYRWDGPSLSWKGPFPVATAVSGAGVNSIVAGLGISIDNMNPAIPVVGLSGVINKNGAALPPSIAGTILQIGAADAATNRLLFDAFGASSVLSMRRANGTAAAKTALASGTAIGALAAYGYVAVEQPETLPALEPWQFRAMLDIGEIAQAVDDAIAAIAETTERAVAKARFEYSLSFRRDDPLIAMLAPAVSLTDEQIDALWSQAVQLKTRTA